MFDAVDPKQSFSKLEEEIIKYWRVNKIFEKSVTNRSKDNEYIFYDGPPFATGLPHYGHLLAGTMKDVVPRYWTMRGKRVERRWGWDCHGLPIEYEVEKELGLSGRKDIEEKYGVAEFCEKCRDVVLRYTEEWKKTVERTARWVDMENHYKTMDPSFMESTWWVFKQLWEKDLVYRGHKAMHVCPRCVTPLSNFEVTLGYKDVSDPSVMWKFKVKNEKNTYLLAWTTTPWSSISTMGLSVHPGFIYVKVKIDKDYVIFVKDRIDFVLKEYPDYEIVDEFRGEKLVGIEYEPLTDDFLDLPEVKENKNVYHVFGGDYVELTAGTGIVTINGSYGEIDMDAANKNGLPIVMDVDMNGVFNNLVKTYEGMYVKDAQYKFIEDMRNKNLVWNIEKYKHSYPHCWRCDTPLLNYTTTSWFVRVEKIKDQMIKENNKIHWVPEHVGSGRFGDWLENARDWCVSRNRFWGTPLPIWISDDGDFYCMGSIEELAKLSGEKIIDIHKHKIDGITFKKDGKIYRRIPDVFDCWFEAGSMPYAQSHYPFENKEQFERNFPAEYIAEGLDQTRGWFYTLVVLGVALFGKAPFKNVIVNGLILAEDGKKMSKSLKNYPEPGIVLNKYGADALRFYLMNSPAVKAEPLCFSEKGVENVVKNVILPIWNAYSFFVTYANIDQWQLSKTYRQNHQKLANKLDQWIFSELHTLIKETTEQMDQYNLQAIRPIYHFIEQLTNWYIRRSRRRFWKNENDVDKEEGYQTLYTVLTTLCQVMAPVMPLISESMYRNLTKEESVHLTDWPEYDLKFIDQNLNQEMELVMLIARLGNAARARVKIKNRQPLQKIQIGLPDEKRKFLTDDQIEVLKEELNVKKVEISDDPSSIAKMIVRPNAKILGPKFGRDVQFIIQEAKVGNFELLENGGIKIAQFELTPEEFNVGYESQEGLDVESDHGVVVALDTTLTSLLKKEGIARDLVRFIQDMRKEANYKVDDRILVSIEAEGKVGEAVADFEDYIMTEILASKLQTTKLAKVNFEKTIELEGENIRLSLWRSF
ncbi:MAG: isoleucyl-tRNA synthetase, isoleucyl-tRNA synthetase [Candidatus Peregrinibacteria bacterium GW2011_GWE2_39_6]|nr:MAG: isoleucyl-tRNA synthetase, isoleucyl-tRNA synthetase [Candidatus Peregrinibacteria bacterium GW2011_GWF2_39_17]KKR26172.1 MAG: isoleucyl-tRNA synthetase, isoleucyl-tRNA synthetase [Candidatus Peregrinibacteria bacterium GW2011_GWE2_39_6]HCW32296.1 isoleucine--tRNA ligase [Candidatus Peregrinibacteria bacterium]